MDENGKTIGKRIEPDGDLLQRGGVLHYVAEHALDVGLTLGLTNTADAAKHAIKDVIHRPHKEPPSAPPDGDEK